MVSLYGVPILKANMVVTTYLESADDSHETSSLFSQKEL